MMKVIIDWFGKSVKTEVVNDESFCAIGEFDVSQTFFGRLIGFAIKIQIVSPEM